PAAFAGGPSMVVGAAENIVEQDTPDLAKAQMDRLELVGFDAVRITSIWGPGQTAPSVYELNQLRNVATAASLDGMRVYVAVYNFGSKTTPLSDQDRADFAAYAASIATDVPTFRDFVIGNEPNLNRF